MGGGGEAGTGVGELCTATIEKMGRPHRLDMWAMSSEQRALCSGGLVVAVEAIGEGAIGEGYRSGTIGYGAIGFTQ